MRLNGGKTVNAASGTIETEGVRAYMRAEGTDSEATNEGSIDARASAPTACTPATAAWP